MDKISKIIFGILIVLVLAVSVYGLSTSNFGGMEVKGNITMNTTYSGNQSYICWGDDVSDCENAPAYITYNGSDLKLKVN